MHYLRNFLYCLIFLLLMAVANIAKAQDLHFSQFYANRLYLNPALTGVTECGEISLNYRNQWPGIPGTFSMINASYDQHVDVLHGGVGVMVNHFMEGNAAYSSTSAGVSYSFDMKLSEDFRLTLGTQANLVFRRINWEHFTFADQYDEYLGIVRPTGETFPSRLYKFYADFSAGLLASYRDWYFGFAVHHFSRPNIAMQSERQRLNIRYTAHIGGRIYFVPKTDRYRHEHLFNITPNIVYTLQGNTNILNYGLYANYHPVVFGVSFRNTFYLKKDPAIQQDIFEAVSFLVGFQHKSINIAYSYDLSLTKIRKIDAGAHEITLSYTLPCKVFNHKTNFEPIYCPKF
ncbi:MAG: PorP/SprF family type IX secretion system membrane protein [Bacteroidales bacterium]|nr:PorP/SprF family type IX secretion system membrane protein [Bacteroidales bacterium]